MFAPVSRAQDEGGAGDGLAVRQPRVTIVVPTFKEVENIPHLIERVSGVHERHDYGIDVDMLFMDDDSRDGSLELVDARPEKWAGLFVRTSDRGLSPAVLDGLRRASGDVLVCMDADLSHPPGSAFPTMLAKLDEGADFVVGSRYAPGGTTSDDWGLLQVG